MLKPCASRSILVAFSVAAFSAGCASAPYTPPRQPLGGDNVPPDVAYYRGQMESSDGTKLLEQCWQPTKPSRALVVLVHDLKDHSSRYRDLGISFANRGLALCGFDLRGHGYSEGVRDHVTSLESFVDDLETLIGRVRAREKGKPLFVLGQGFGADLAAMYALRTKTPLAGVILSAPMLREDLKRGDRIGIRTYAILMPRSNRLDLDLRKFSNEPRVVESMENDSLIYKDKATARTAGEILRASDELRKRATDLNVPLLVLLGSDDQISDPAPARALEEKAATSDKKLQTYEGLSHALFQGSGRTLVINDVSEWIASHAESFEDKTAAPAPAAAVLQKAPPAAAPPAAAPAAAPVKKAALRKKGKAR
jgi:alpha-beta hydrolase superfamily lysophospholipase